MRPRYPAPAPPSRSCSRTRNQTVLDRNLYPRETLSCHPERQDVDEDETGQELCGDGTECVNSSAAKRSMKTMSPLSWACCVCVLLTPVLAAQMLSRLELGYILTTWTCWLQLLCSL
ncbi:N-acetyllactosaminide beta-1,3-N-acetylglucosaminyltransferase 2 isoform 2-T3 [Hipposideros larvatus]